MSIIMKKLYIIFIVYIIGIISVIFAVSQGRCTEDDYEYQFTECDQTRNRWRVSVPRLNTNCEGTGGISPVRVPDCSASCDPGSYFNVTTLRCSMCPPGTYSLGGGLYFDSWNTLPSSFHAYAEAFRTSFSSSRRKGDIDCSDAGWQTRGDVLASQAGQCEEVLVYSVKLVKPGVLIYTYQYTDDSIIFEFQAQNEQCQSINDVEDKKWPQLTREGQWKSVKVQLDVGLNVLHWKTIGIESHGSRRPVLIKSIQISGVAYTSSECSPCPAGTYSEGEALLCKECPEGTYSLKGSDRCVKCNEMTHYAPKGSAHCIPRPPCSTQDYYELDSACDENNKTRAVYTWVKPQVCRENLEDSVKLPPSGELKTCPPCNPGMHYTTGMGCVFCPKDQHSDGVSPCKSCPPSTAPNYGYQYQWWSSMPPEMAATCMSDDDAGCSTSEGWQPGGDHIHSGRGHADDAYLVLSLKVAGFRGREGFANGRPMEVGRISFTFELSCNSVCEFAFMAGSTKKGVTILQSWTGRKPRQYYSYLITRNDSYTFSWAFQKMSWEKSYLKPSLSRVFEKDMAKIFNINVTNTIDGGASSCLPCPQGLEGLGCIPCPAGHYIEENTTECTACPPATVVTDPLPYGPKSCVPCGPGLTSPDGLTCTAKCQLEVDGFLYNFTDISSARVLKGNTLFTTSGAKYFHMYNISLCGDTPVTCANNMSYSLEGDQTSRIVARTCRSTIVPMGMGPNQGSQSDSLATQAVSLGDHLLGVTTNNSLNGINVISEFTDSSHKDLHFYFTTPSSTRACISGRSTTVTLRCDTEESGQGQLVLPRQCPDGTCDGCNFHFLWSTPLGCPICAQDDLIVVRGECVNGKQEIHYINPKTCRSPPILPKRKFVSCSAELPLIVMVIVLSALLIALALCLLLFCLWKKNRNLEYKYMKLIASASSKDGMMELPPAESCALDDGEEEEVQFSQRNHRSILNKLNNHKIGDSSSQYLQSMKMTPLKQMT